MFKTVFSILELQEYGLLSEADFRFLANEKIPDGFSLVENEFG